MTPTLMCAIAALVGTAVLSSDAVMNSGNSLQAGIAVLKVNFTAQAIKDIIAKDNDNLSKFERNVIQQLRAEDEHKLVDLLSCKSCATPLSSKSLATLSCADAVHERCFPKLADGLCPDCKAKPPHDNRQRTTVIREVLKALEDQRYFPSDDSVTVPEGTSQLEKEESTPKDDSETGSRGRSGREMQRYIPSDHSETVPNAKSHLDDQSDLFKSMEKYLHQLSEEQSREHLYRTKKVVLHYLGRFLEFLQRIASRSDIPMELQRSLSFFVRKLYQSMLLGKVNFVSEVDIEDGLRKMYDDLEEQLAKLDEPKSFDWNLSDNSLEWRVASNVENDLKLLLRSRAALKAFSTMRKHNRGMTALPLTRSEMRRARARAWRNTLRPRRQIRRLDRFIPYYGGASVHQRGEGNMRLSRSVGKGVAAPPVVNYEARRLGHILLSEALARRRALRPNTKRRHARMRVEHLGSCRICDSL